MKRIIPLFSALVALVVLAFATVSNPESTKHYGFDLGLDLAGGTNLVYEADISKLETIDVADSISSLQAVLERRLNALGSSDIRVRTEQSSIFAHNSERYYRVNVSIPGIFDSSEAQALIGEIPVLEFRLGPNSTDPNSYPFNPRYENTTDTGISGKHVVTATISAHGNAVSPAVDLSFNREGGELFFDLTRENVDHYLVILLDGEVISAPTIQAAIAGGTTTISGQFTYESAGELASNLKFGALPIPIKLVASESISPSLGEDIITKGIIALAISLVLIGLILIFLYGIAGLVASATVSLYTLLLLSYFKFTGTDMTASGIAGLIITVGMAVDANVLIFERIREEISARGTSVRDAIEQGFARAWPSIRDGNVSSIIVACILYFLTTSFVKGFALAFGVGVLISMFTAVVVTRSLLLAVASSRPLLRRFLVGKVIENNN